MTDDIHGLTALSRGLRLKCPRCGQGRLFRSYLKQQERCPLCAENFSGISADDGPAWLTMLIVGHIVVLTVLHMESANYDSMALEMTVAGLSALVLAVVILPFAKGLFISALWLLRRQKEEG